MLALLVTELDDRNAALALNPAYIAEIDFSESDVPAARAHKRLVELNEEWGLGLVKPLRRSTSETFVFFEHGAEGIPGEVPRMDGSVSAAASVAALEHSVPGGVYLVLERGADLEGFSHGLREMGAELSRVEEVSVGGIFRFYLVQQPMILFSIFALLLLLGALTVYWVGVRGRRRQQELFFGQSARLIIARDVLTLTLPFVLVLALGGAVLFFSVDSPFHRAVLLVVLKIYLFLIGALLTLLFFALWMVRPRVKAAGSRTAWMERLRPLIFPSKGLAIACILLAFPWVILAYSDSTSARRAHDIAYRIEPFAGFGVVDMPNEDFENNLADFGEVVLDLQREGSAVFSYLAPPMSVGLSEEDSALGFANTPWLEAVDFSGRVDSDEVVTWAGLPQKYRESIPAEIWLRERDTPPEEWRYHIVRSGSGIGMLLPNMSGVELVHDMVLVEVPSIADFNDSFLTSALSMGNIVARDIDEAYRARDSSEIGEYISVYYIGENAMYIAKMLEYRERIMVISFVVLVIAFVVLLLSVAAVDSALNARRNMLRNLAGYSLWGISLSSVRADMIVISLSMVLSAAVAAIFGNHGIVFLPGVAVGLTLVSVLVYLVMAKRTVAAAMQRKI
ncbi:MULTISPECIES: hypothetical protein [unclassified Corynebacterium]|uniref:hypothetical protein n=1 Tax=unclassified Corynebacterium TaxID=2624378 RepID=UPI0029CA184F|nr:MULTISPECIES: hypothetical protein [unclassified Corynebacterium]WPF66931.1 hypothetical protein OLX12_04190 [Corynebacterium sp. 22KM0430]WPF69419.1 hypothetical protein OLW90_04185 [Corynebacterium sp. 21KM1197]